MDIKIEEKKRYLSTYRLQQAKIGRITEMLSLFGDQETELKKQLLEARQRRDKIEQEILALDDEILCELLSQKYLCGRSLSQIAICMNYSKRQIERLHKKALTLFVFEY